MERLTRWTCLMILVVSLTQLQISESCSCTPSHPQESFRRSEYVALFRLKGSMTVNETETAYKVVVHRIFKATPEARKVLERKPAWVWTASMDSICGNSGLTSGKTWLIGGQLEGNKLHTSLCDLSILWSDVNFRQRNGFRNLYQRGKSCEVTYTEWANKGAAFESSNGTSCLWESWPGPTECQERFGICRYNNDTCSWAPSRVYNQCIKEYQRRRVQQLNSEP